jgi:uncharacterized protein YjbJ (UPF0337 family)
MSYLFGNAGPERRPKSGGLKSSTKDKIEGTARTAAGIIKEETGKATDNPELRHEGVADQFVGNTQKSIGKIKKALGS